MQQWTPAQVHDTIAVIVSQAEFARDQRESWLGWLLRLFARWIGNLYRWTIGTLDARLVVVAAFGLLVVIVFGRIVVARQLEERRRLGDAIAGRRNERRDYWAIARELAAADRLLDATHAVYAAVLEGLASTGQIKFHASKTTGDYARELRRARSPVAAEFYAFGRDFDRTVYGRSTVTRDEFERLFAAGRHVTRATHAERAA